MSCTVLLVPTPELLASIVVVVNHQKRKYGLLARDFVERLHFRMPQSQRIEYVP